MKSSTKLLRSIMILAGALTFASAVTACGHKKHARSADDDDDDAPRGKRSGGVDDGSADFNKAVADVRSYMQGQSHGVGIVAKYLQEKTQKRLSLKYVDDTPPEWKESLENWVIISKAKDTDDSIISTVAMALPQLAPGHYEGSASRKEVKVGATLGKPSWDPTADDTAWSMNEDGWCQVDMKSANSRGDLEGTFKGKLNTNVPGTYYLIEDGYFYIRR